MIMFNCISVFAAFFVIPLVHAAVCTNETDNKCEKTDSTLESCNSATKTCDCIDGYLPIPSGCSEKPMKPSVTLDGRTKLVVSGQNAALKCSTNITSESNVEMTFEWRIGSRITETTSQIYNIIAADSEKLGRFSCKVKFRGTNLSIESDYSEAVEMSLLTENTPLSAVVIDIPEMAVEGALLYPKCTGIPFGTTYKFQINNSQIAEAPMTYKAPLSELQIRCVIDDIPNFKFHNSTKYGTSIPFPELATGIQDVRITHSALHEDLTFRTGTPFRVTCFVPVWTYPRGSIIKYTFIDSANPSPVVDGNTYNVPSDSAETHEITCSATDGINKNSSLLPLKVTFSNNYIKKPHMKVSPNPVSVGSQLIITCTMPYFEKLITYSWSKDDVTIFLQHDRVIQFGNVSSQDKGKYACIAKKHNYISKSNEVIVIVPSTSDFALAGSPSLLLIVAAVLSLLT